MLPIETDILKGIDMVEIPESLIEVIADKITSTMNDKIRNISPDDDPSATYDEWWTNGSCDGEDIIELDKPFDEYEVCFNYSLTWRYRTWTECWNDPVCYPSFDELDGETGKVYDIDIITPDGDAVKQIICNAIAKKVNDKIK